MIFDLSFFFRKKAGLQSFIKNIITPEPLEIFALLATSYLCFIRLLQFFKIDYQKMWKTSFF
jgi:hypothetical protein